MSVRIAPLALALLVLVTTPGWPAGAQSGPRLVRVAVQFQQSGQHSRDGVQRRGGVVISGRNGVWSRARIEAQTTDTRVRSSTGIFTLVQDGAESTITVATQVPYTQVAFYRDYATGAGYVASGVTFRDVGTSLKVRANLLPGNQVRVRLTPSISWLSSDSSGSIDFTEASTDVTAASGAPVVLGGAASQTHAVTREILGIGTRSTATETTVVLTATAQ